jgi:hypothetical protein
MKKKFKELTDSEIKNFGVLYKDKSMSWDDKMKSLSEFCGGISERTVRTWAKSLGFIEREITESIQFTDALERVVDKNKKRFLITWGQNNTKVHKKFFNNMEAYAEYLGADIHVIAGKYHLGDGEDIMWDSAITPYLDANTHDIHKFLSIESGVPILATAVNPLSGLAGFGGNKSTIFGHPKVQMETVPVLEGERPKVMMTTGACTVPNYTNSKSGAKGIFHHTMGFIVVEIKDDNTFFMRQVTALEGNGSFSDLFLNVKDGQVTKIDEIAACILGDIHYGQHEERVITSTHEMLEKIKPKHVVLHDVFDGLAISHHEIKNPFIQYGREMDGTNDLKKEVNLMLDNLASFEKYENVVVVKSNHDEVIDKWLISEDWRKQPTMKNAPEYMRYSAILLEQYRTGNVKGVIPALVNERYPKFHTLDRRKGYKVKGFELGYHGDVANNGARGSLLGFRKLNTKCVVGHYHSPGRKDGALAVGTSTKLRVNYNLGGSSWAHANVLIHNNGKAQHVFFDPETFEYTTLK